MERIDISMNLIDERERLGYSRRNFAEQTNISGESLRLYEAGKTSMSADFLVAAAQLGVDVQFVLTGIRSANLNLVSNAVETKFNQQIEDNRIENQFNGDMRQAVITTGSTVHNIHTTSHVTKTIAEVKPGELHIDDNQAAQLQRLVYEIVEQEEKVKRKPKTRQAVWSSLNAYCKVPKYRLIPKVDFSKAEKFLRMWLGRLNNTTTAQKSNNTEWRNTKYAYIKINTKQLGLENWLDDYVKKNFQVSSIKDLNNDELQKTYQAVATKKRGGR